LKSQCQIKLKKSKNIVKTVVKDINVYYKWCKPCQINNFKKKFANWTSGNEKIIQEMQLKISELSDVIVEWIPYDHLNDIKEIVILLQYIQQHGKMVH